MFWTPEKPSGGFSSCVTEECLRMFTSYQLNYSQANVKVRRENFWIHQKRSIESVHFRSIDSSLETGVTKN